MAIPKQLVVINDFSSGEVDVDLKRGSESPTATGGRQMSNWRVLNSRKKTNRPGRSALFLEKGRVEEVLMSPGNRFFLAFGNGYLRVYNAAGALMFSTTQRGDGTPIPWTSATVKNIVWTLLGVATLHSIIITYADGFPSNQPLDLSWDGLSQTSQWTMGNYGPSITGGNQSRTMFYRLSPQGVTLLPSGTTGACNLTFSFPVLYSGMIGARLSFCGRQITITNVTASDYSTPVAGPSQYGRGLIDEPLPGGQSIGFNSGDTAVFNNGDEVIGATSGAKGIVTNVTGTQLQVQLIPTGSGAAILFANAEVVAGPGGSATNIGITNTGPAPVSIWADEVMNNYRGWPSSCFFDQGRLGFCNFPALQSAIAWSAIGIPGDFWVDPSGTTTASSAILELAPGKSQVLYVQPGMESSEFVFCDNAIYYIPISQQQPLEPGSVAFTLLNQQGCYPVQPCAAEQVILYVMAGGEQIGAVQAPGAYYRPYVIDYVSEFHSHLFAASPPIAIAVPAASVQFQELYAYVLLANGTIIMGRYSIKEGLLDVGPEGKAKIGWLPWSGAGTPTWISALQADLIVTNSYAPNGIAAVGVVEKLDAAQYLDAAIFVNSPPTALAAPAGKGPLWWIAGGSVFLIDLGTRFMGVYQIDANGWIIPQYQGGENLLSSQLVAGQPWTAIFEPFLPDAGAGPDQRQRTRRRKVARAAVSVESSSGFVYAKTRVPAYFVGDNAEIAAPLRESTYRFRYPGRYFDPRVVLQKDTPGPLVVLEHAIEVTI